MATKQAVKRKLTRKIEKVSGYQNVVPGRLGTSSNSAASSVETGIPGLVYVRIEGSGQVVTAINPVASAENNHPVLLAKSKVNHKLWEIIGSRQAYSIPVSGNLRFHHPQHEHPNPDTVWVRADQFLPFLVMPDGEGAFGVQIYGGITTVGGVRKKVKNQKLDLSSLLPTTGAKWVLIEVTSTGAIGTVDSSEVDSKELLDPVDIPLPSADAMELCAVRLYAGQQLLQRDTINDFVDLRFGRPGGGGSGAFFLDDLLDVNTPAPTDGQVLIFDAYADEWIAEDPPEGGLHSHMLDSLSDVDVPAPMDGQVLTYDAYAEEWIAGDPTGGMDLGWFDVTDYGAVGDGVTDDTSAINDAIDALNTAGRGVLYFPGGQYLCSAALTAITAVTLIMGDGISSIDNAVRGSEILCSSETAALFTINAKTGKFRDLAIRNTAGTNPTAGAAIVVTGAYIGQRVDYDNISVHGFYIDVDTQVGAQWVMNGCHIAAPILYGVKVRNIVNADAGDWVISNTNINAGRANSTAGIRIESSGGGKVIGCKINMSPLGSTYRFDYGIDVSGAGDTSILIVAGTSIENYDAHAIHATGTWDYMVISGCQMANYTDNDTSAISLDGMDYFVISGCVMVYGPPNTTSVAAIALANCTNGVLVGLQQRGFGDVYSETSCSNISYPDGGASSATYTDISTNDPDTDVTGAELEELTDGSETALHSHAGGGGGVRLVMMPGVSSPPVPVETPDGEDWIYVDI